MSNKTDHVLYVGVTGNLGRRVYEHKQGIYEGFTKKYHVTKLVYYESTTDVYQAITREKQIKNLSRMKKEKLIDTLNPERKDLYERTPL